MIDENSWEEYSAGIHFFITRQEAIDKWCLNMNDTEKNGFLNAKRIRINTES